MKYYNNGRWYLKLLDNGECWLYSTRHPEDGWGYLGKFDKINTESWREITQRDLFLELL